MDQPVVFRARRAVLSDGERAVDVVVRDGRITDLAPFGTATGSVIDVPGDCQLLPGLVDTHVHVNEPGRTHWEGFATATAAAAAGGVTTIVDMPLNSIPATVTVDALERKRVAARDQLAVDVAFWGGAIPGNVADLEPLHRAGVVGFKCFLLPSGVDEFPPLDQADLAAAMREIARFDGLLIAHAEDGRLISEPHGLRYRDFLASRPDAAETSAIEGLLAETERTGCRTHIVHLSSAASLPVIAKAKAAGLPVTVETCPHYLTLTADEIPDGATQFKCCPPIRDAANQDQLWRALQDGLIDLVVSDHSPSTLAEKRGDFGTAWGGIASLQLGLSSVWTAAAERNVPMSDVIQWMATAPARLIGLDDRGQIAVGRTADLSVFAPDEEFTVDVHALAHRNPVSPYDGRQLRGVVRSTYLRGQPIDPDHRTGRMVTTSGEERDG